MDFGWEHLGESNVGTELDLELRESENFVLKSKTVPFYRGRNLHSISEFWRNFSVTFLAENGRKWLFFGLFEPLEGPPMVHMDIYQLYYVAYIIDISFREIFNQKLFTGALAKASIWIISNLQYFVFFTRPKLRLWMGPRWTWSI